MDHRNIPPSEPDVKRFNQWAATYDRSVMQSLFFRPVHAKMLGLLERELSADPPGRIIDVGCGTGRLLRAVSARWPKTQVFGVDPAKEMIAEASRLNPEGVFKVGQAEALPFPDQAVDVVLSSISFHHWADHAKGIQEVARVLRPGGVFCLADHSFLLARVFGEQVRSGEEIRSLMADAGLAVRRQLGMGLRFVLITLARKAAQD